MANNKVKFLRGTSDKYAVAEKDSDAIYFTTDDGKLYIGDKEVSGADVTIDSKLSNTSENPAQNKVVTTELNKKANKEIYGDTTINMGRDPDTTVGDKSIAFGTDVESSGIKSIATGSTTRAIGNHAFAGGIDTTANSNVSFAYGYGLETNKRCTAAFGEYNKSDENTLFSIGNGDSDTERSNAFEITKTGGKLHDKDIATADNIPTSLPADGGNADTANKLASSSYTTLTIDTTDWTDNSDGGYMYTYTLSSSMPYTNFNFDVVLSTDQSAAKLQIEAWNCIIADGEITQTTSSGSTTAFTFYAFTNKPSVAITVGIQGVS